MKPDLTFDDTESQNSKSETPVSSKSDKIEEKRAEDLWIPSRNLFSAGGFSKKSIVPKNLIFFPPFPHSLHFYQMSLTCSICLKSIFICFLISDGEMSRCETDDARPKSTFSWSSKRSPPDKMLTKKFVSKPKDDHLLLVCFKIMEEKFEYSKIISRFYPENPRKLF